MIRNKLRLGFRAAAVALGLMTASVGGYGGVLFYTGNIHAVSEGELYRSAQLDKDEFAAAIRQYGIRSILNLRGAHPGEAWYDDEVAAANEAGVTHYDVALSARRQPNEAQIKAVLRVLREAPKPLLVHCKSGADRSGLVSALFRLVEENATPEEADRQLSLVYGHFPYLTSKTVAMDESFWAFVRREQAGGEPPR
jgi:protein tyrosine/serine phosphatase